MASNSNSMMPEMTAAYDSLSIGEDEEDGLVFQSDDMATGQEGLNDVRFCLVGRFLTDKVINFLAMKNTMAALWRPGKGPHRVPLFHILFWIQVYNLPIRFQSEKVLTNIGNYIGEFQSSDPNNLMGVWRNFMRIRIASEEGGGGEWFWVDFKYERLNVFCFICGLLGHTEKLCPKLYDCEATDMVRLYGPEMKAPTRRNAMTSGERWLRSVPPNKGGFTFGMPTKFVSRAEINDTNAKKSGVTTNRKMPNNFGRDGHEHMENMEISKALAVVKIRENQRNDKGKGVDWFTNELDIVHVADSCREKGIVLKETKRRRAEMVVPTETNEYLELELPWFGPATDSSNVNRTGSDISILGRGLGELIDGLKNDLTEPLLLRRGFLQCVATKVTSEHNSMLLAPFSAIEVKDAVFGMHPDKSPGPDGMNPAFYQKFWHIVGEDVVLACLKFLQDASFPVGLNDTSIVLIPKKQRPEFLSDMRPIALCNVLYKIISKMLANRMKLVLDLVISDSQSAFRKWQGKNGVAALKIDMSKAYDRIKWKFLQDMMLKMGFDAKWVALMMLSPSVSHLFLADDSFLFFRANDNEANLIKHLLAVYGRASGQVVNFSKSSISFSANVVESVSREISIGRKKKEVFKYIRDKLWQRLQGWSTRMLSRAGKEILLKTVALALPNYAMSIYLLPKELCRELEGLMNSFWWRNNHSSGKGINWVKWEYLCNPKGCGGLGFKQLHLFNIAMLGRQMWKLLTCPESLMARILKARYYPRTSVVRASLGHNPSYVWRSILAAKEVVVQGSRVQVGSGHSISIGKDPWLPDLQDGCVSTNLNEELAAAPVSSLMMPHQRVWDYDVIWVNRNNKVWNNTACSVCQILNSAGQFLYQWQAAKRQVFDINDDTQRLVHGALCWEKPKFGWVKCNVDAAVFASQGKIGIGCVIRNSQGGFLAARCVEVVGNFGAREAEALSIREALSWMKELHFPCVIIEMDCLQVFRALVEEFSSPNGFGLIIEDCRALVKFIGEVQFSFVCRSANCAAHSVARASGSLSGLQEWNIVPPVWLLNNL
ncbi:reverse transcriptase domain-containing protein [Citrus sinensis]|nr:reverse transcriptase domain-containing protein [Citrus sinensis]